MSSERGRIKSMLLHREMAISFIEKLSFTAFNEGTRPKHCLSLAEKLTGVSMKKVIGDESYSGNDN